MTDVSKVINEFKQLSLDQQVNFLSGQINLIGITTQVQLQGWLMSKDHALLKLTAASLHGGATPEVALRNAQSVIEKVQFRTVGQSS